MAVMLSTRNTGHAGYRTCQYGCCGDIAVKANKKFARRTIRTRDKAALRKAIRSAD